MSFEKIKIALEAGKFEPVYFFSGEESYYIDTLTALIEKNALTETQRAFNQHVFYGKDSEPQEVVNAARRYPAFSERQLVIVKEAPCMSSVFSLRSRAFRASSVSSAATCSTFF